MYKVGYWGGVQGVGYGGGPHQLYFTSLSRHTSSPIDYAFRYNAFFSLLLLHSFHLFLFLVESAKSMEAHTHGGRLASAMKAKKELEGEDEDDEMVDEEEEEEEESEECDLKRKKLDLGSVGLGKKGSSGGGGRGGGGVAPSCCQVEKCGADLTFAKTYHKRHKVCEVHAKAPAVLLNGVDQRFCQQCSRFHEVTEFDEAKRSCRRRLAGHNERRRKASSENRGEGSSRRRVEGPLKESKQCNPVEGRGGSQLIISETSSYKNFHIH